MKPAISRNDEDIDYMAMVTHQLSTPLSAVRWNAEILRLGSMAKPLDKDQAAIVDEIIVGAVRMGELVSDLQVSTQLEQDKLDEAPVAVDLSKAIAEAQKKLQSAIDTKKLKYTVKAGPATPAVAAGPSLVAMVAQNLLSNAVKYTPEKGSVTITLRAATDHEAAKLKTKAKKVLYLAIADTGYGIPAAQQKRVFSKLFRGDNVRALSIEGTGLGLYISALVVAKLGGDIWFESTENKGSTFFALLPAAEADTNAKQ